MIETNFYTITLHKNLIISNFFGSWDIAITKEYLEEAFTIIRQRYSKKPYAVIDDCTNWGINTPDAIQFWKETFTNASIPLPTHVAYVVGDSELKSWVMKTMTKDAGPFEKAVFHDLTEGLKWLESHGYIANSKNSK